MPRLSFHFENTNLVVTTEGGQKNLYIQERYFIDLFYVLQNISSIILVQQMSNSVYLVFIANYGTPVETRSTPASCQAAPEAREI